MGALSVSIKCNQNQVETYFPSESLSQSILKGQNCFVKIHLADQSIDFLLKVSINAAYIFITENSKILFILVGNFVQCSKVFVNFDTKDYSSVKLQ